jgi:hypothetical protein
MYDRFSDKGAHSTEWFEAAKNFLKLAFAVNHHEAKCPCNRWWNRRMLSEYEMSSHIARHGFMLDYMVWQQHEDQLDDMIADIGMEYDIRSGDQHRPPEVQNLYRLLATSDEKGHDGTELIILKAVTHLMGMKSKYNFSNQCYNDFIKLIIDLIPVKHNISKDLYQSKMIVAGPDTECMYCSRSRYVKVVNECGVSVTTKVAVKQICYMSITPWLK